MGLVKDFNEIMSPEPIKRITKKTGRREEIISLKLVFSIDLFLILLGTFSSFLYDPADYRWLLVFGFLSVLFTIVSLIIKAMEDWGE